MNSDAHDKSIRLGSLEFKAEDFQNNLYGNEVPRISRDFMMSPECAAQVANDILREKLEKATKVFSYGNECDLWSPTPREGELDSHTHTARLVCIEPLVLSKEIKK